MGFDFRKAAVLSLCVVVGSLMIQQFLNRKLHHPDSNTRPLPYWDFIIVYLPAQLMGGTLGIFVRDMIPQAVLESVAVLVLTVVATKTIIKGMNTYIAESAHFDTVSAIGDSEDSIGIMSPLIGGGTANREENHAESSDNGTKLVQPWVSIAALAGTGIVYTAVFAGIIFVPKCSPAYVTLLCGVFLPMAALEIWATRRVSRIQREDPSATLKGDLNWEKVFHWGLLLLLLFIYF